MPKASPHLRSTWTGALLSTLFALTHLFRLSYHGFWIDELHTFGSISGSFRELIADRLAAGHIPTYFILMQAWTRVAGVSEGSLRFPSVLAAAFAFFAFFLLVREFLTETRPFLAALALFFFHPFLLWASHDARMYALVAAVSILAAHQLLRYLRTEQRGALTGYVLACVLGLSIHLLFLLQMAAHLSFTAFHYRKRLKVHAGVMGLLLALLGPLALLTASKAKAYKPALRLRFPDASLVVRKTSILVSTDFNQYLAPGSLKAQALARGLSLVFFLWFVAAAIVRLRGLQKAEAGTGADEVSPERDLLRFSFHWMGVPACLIMLSQAFNNTWVNAPRYYIPSLGAITILAAACLAATPAGLWRRFAAGAYVLFFAWAIAVQLAWRGPGIREALQRVREQGRPGDGIIFCHSGALSYSFDFYACGQLPRLPVDREDRDAAALLRQVQAFAQDKQRLWVVLHNPQDSPLPALLSGHAEAFEPVADEVVQNTEVKLFRVAQAPRS